MAVPGLTDVHELSLAVVSGGYSCDVTHGLLIVLASLVVEHRLDSCGARV